MSIMIPPKRPMPVKAGPLGPGSGVLQTEFPLAQYGIGRQSPQRKMQRAWALSFEVPWIAAAEDAITERFAGVDWHLEDENDVEIDDTYPNPDARAAQELIEQPAANLPVGASFYQADLWALTARAMGVCGSAIIFLDQPEALGGTPAAMLPIAPWRMSEKEDANGNLIGWYIDKAPDRPGVEVSLEQILHYKLRPNFGGHFGVGLMESAMRKLQISQGLDDHMGMVLSAGGRLSGIVSPSTGTFDPEQMVQMERDWRTVVEQSDAAKRLQLVRGPVKFDRTTLTPAELQIVDLLKNARDDLLALWGVPLSIIGGSTPSGLNSGDTRKYDEAAIWQGPVHHRLNVFRTITQYQMLDRWRSLNATVELELDEPEFDDDSPRYDLLGKSINTAMTDDERRALIGKEPLPNGLGLTVRLPATVIPAFLVPAEGEAASPTEVVLGRTNAQVSSTAPAMLAAGETGKATLKPHVQALHTSLVNLRGNLQRHAIPRIKSSVAAVLAEQRTEIASRLRRNAAHIAAKPNDIAKWWDGPKWDKRMTDAIRPSALSVATSVNSHIATILPAQKAGPEGAVERVLTRGVARVTGINETTKTKIQEAIARGIDEGLSITDIADLIEGIDTTADIGLDLPSAFDEYRAELIARTETMDAYNASALGSYTDAGIEMVEPIDGDEDEECQARLARGAVTVDEAMDDEDHPNGTLDWLPVVGTE